MRHEWVTSTRAAGETNEDLFWVGPTRLGTLVVLADGLDGAAAAAQAVAFVRETFEEGRVFDAYFWKHFLSNVDGELNSKNETALVVCHLIGGRLTGAACGDVRVFAGEQSLSEGHAKARLGRNFDGSNPGVFEAELAAGTRLAIVSNGVWEYLPKDEFARTLRDSFFDSVAVDLTWRAAPDGRWQDDATAIVIELRE